MNKFWELLKESVIIQSVIALVLVSTICIIFLKSGEVPKELMSLVYLVVGFYFGAKTQYSLSRKG